MDYIFDYTKYVGRKVKATIKAGNFFPYEIIGTIKKIESENDKESYCNYEIVYDEINRFTGATCFSLEKGGEPIGADCFVLEIEVLPEEAIKK